MNNGIYAAFLNKFGKILSDCIIYKFDNFLLINLSLIGKNNVIEKLKNEAELGSSNIEDVTLKYGLFSLQGPKAFELISIIIGDTLKNSKNFSSTIELKQQHQCTIKKITIDKNAIEEINNNKNNEEIEIVITKNNRTNFDGYDIFVPVSFYNKFKELIINEGKKYNLEIINNEAYNILRIEAKIPLFGIDFDDKNILPEITEKAVSYSKGCYVGQEIVARIKNLAKGLTAKKLMFLEIDGKEVPKKNAKITKGSKEIGYITSADFSPEFKKVIGFGFLYRGFYAAENVTFEKI